MHTLRRMGTDLWNRPDQSKHFEHILNHRAWFVYTAYEIKFFKSSLRLMHIRLEEVEIESLSIIFAFLRSKLRCRQSEHPPLKQYP